MLRILNPNELVDQLRNGQAQPVPVLILMTVNIVFQSISGYPGFFGPLSSQAAFPFVLLQIGMSLAALWVGFSSNGGSRGRDFLTRFFSISAVLYFWVFVAGYFVYVLASWFIIGALGSSAIAWYRPYGPAQLLFGGVTSLVYLLSLQHFFSKLSPKATR